ncbi:MAG: porin [Oceanospirillaceae bacterium]|uniref:porin n=1 Tax=unclassified Thalassolituus TaxID=2624967 RepID=UPI000C5CF1BF|nr:MULTISPECIES: porin [unclassified Thalassolituus]MAY00052.1 porin [Oceanospirillaceae bacterium]MBL36259.1 porin [Oceanospirillaceae bacterium]MBS53776.1 porin [Oceanospirillaceae bacterium]|tara:strand:+ start:520 stop:1446 length:927 start_codon:yes stop_codon:yes gene_type:complete
MKKLALSLAVAAPLAVNAETIEIEKPEFYGKINVAQEFVQQKDAGNLAQLNSNASRLGVKGTIDLDAGLTGIYQAEFEMYPDDGDKDSDRTFAQRNTYIGIKSAYGTLQAGIFDTPFKKAQKKVDLFNDLQGDIKHIISDSENRAKNSVQYTSPEFAGLTATVDHINSEDEEINNGLSASLAYQRGDIYLAYAYDTDVSDEGTEAQRVAGQYSIGLVQLGALWETQDDGVDSKDGWMASAKVKVASKVSLKAQYGASDIKEEGGVTYSLGADYKLTKVAKTFVYATSEESDDESVNAQYYGVGLEYKF